MAYLVGDMAVVDIDSGNYASITINLSAYSFIANDYVVIPFQNGSTSATISETSGGGTTWTLVTLNVASGNRMGFAYAKVASGPTISNPTFSMSSGTGVWQAFVGVVRDADATTFLLGSATADGGNVASASTGALTPSADNSLILYLIANRASNGVKFLPGDAVCEAKALNDSTIESMAVGSVQQTTAAATAKTYYNAGTVRCGAITLAIKNKAGGKLNNHGVAGITKLAWLGGFGDAQDGLTWSAPDNGGVTWDGTGKINGITVDATALSRSSATTFAPNWGSTTVLSGTLSTAGAWQGIKAALPGAVDATGKLLYLEFSVTATNSPAGNEGVLVTMHDGSGNWRAYQLGKRSALFGGLQYAKVIDLTNSTPYASGGSFNIATLTNIHFFTHRVGSSATSRGLNVRNMMLLSNTVLVGGSADFPVTPKYLDKVLNGWGFAGICDVTGGAVSPKSDVQIGNGAFPTYYDATASYVGFPAAFDSALQFKSDLVANSLDFTIYAASGDTIKDTANAVVGGIEQNYAINASSSASATYDYTGKTFVNMLPSLLAGISVANATVSGCDTLDTKGANLTSFVVADTTSTNAAVAVTGSGSTLDLCTIDVTGTSAAYHLELGTAVTAITLTNVDFVGAPGTDKVHVLKTTGTVTITISGTTSLAAGDVTSAGATVVISAPQLYQTVTVTNLVVGSRVQIYDTTSSTELANEVAAGTSVVWTDADPAVSSRAIRVRIAYVSGATAKHFIEASIGTCGVTEGTEAVTYLANQTADDVYVTNAIDGSAVTGVTFTDAATDLTNVNVPGGSISWGQIYAATAYWLFGATGITNDIAMIDAPDPANYRFTAMKVKNLDLVNPLKITGGYGYDATSGSIEDVIDTSAGSIFPMPDHVVSKVVTVTGGNVITGDIADIPAAPSAATVAAAVVENSKTLTVGKFLGLK